MAERPIDPDDLPIAAEQTDDERALAQTLQASGSHLFGGSLGPLGASYYAPNGSNGDNGSNGANGEMPGVGGRRFSLRALSDRLTPRSKEQP